MSQYAKRVGGATFAHDTVRRQPLLRASMRAIVFTTLMAFATACSSSSESTEPQAEEPLPNAYPENRGQNIPLTDITGNVPIRWAGSSELVYYTVAISQIVTEIKAVNISTQATRVLHRGGNVGYTGYRNVMVSPDGRHVFASLAKGFAGDADLIHVADGGPSTLIRPSAGADAVILPTIDSKGVVYGAGIDSLRSYDVTTRTSSRLGEGCGTPGVFSPDGGSLLCRRGNSYFIMSVVSGSTTPMTQPAGSVVSAFWGIAGIEFLTSGVDELRLVKANTGNSTVVLQKSQLRDFEQPETVSVKRSPDGRKIAISTHRWTTLFGSTDELVLYVIDSETLKMDRVAVVKTGSENRISAMAFSPDGRSIAYVVGSPSGGLVYLSPIP